MKRLTIEEVKKEFEKEGYTLLAKTYKNNKQKLEYICPKGHHGRIAYGNWKSLGARCQTCANLKTGDRCRISYSEVKKKFESRGYTLLSETYKNSSEKLKFKCPKEHVGYISFGAFKAGQGCKICGIEQRASKRRLSFNSVKEYVESRGYKLLSKTYKNTETKLRLLCSKGHIWKVTFHNFKNGQNCGICCGNNKRYEYDDVKSIFEVEDYQLISKKYNSNRDKLDVVCPEGHEWKVNLHDFNAGYRCPECYVSGKSSAEIDIYDFIKEYFPDAINGDRSVITPFELDIVIPSKKIAIEYCGLYWHSELMGKTKKYHISKLDKCSEAGYKLITIFEDEWLTKKEIVKSRLLNILGVSPNKKIYARKCDIKKIDTRMKNEFLDLNHLQGADKSSIKLGAFYNNKLVSVMTFSKGSISKGSKAEDGIYELNRFCSDYRYSVIGVASKLFKYFVTNYNPKEIFTYGDLRWSTGELYKNLGFEFVHRSQPNYWYIQRNGFIRQHRFNFRKNVLKDKLEEFDPKLTEWQNMIKNGYNRIWDCGNVKWRFFSKN